MKHFLTILTVVGALCCASSVASASLPGDTLRLTPTNTTLTSIDVGTTNMLAQCYGGGYGGGYGGYGYRSVGYAPVYRNYYRGGSGISVNFGGGRGFGGYPGVYRGYGGYRGFGPSAFGPGFGGRGFSRGGVGLFLNF